MNLLINYMNASCDFSKYLLCLLTAKGAILIFLPGYDDIVTIRDRIINEEKQFLAGGKYCLFCLHSSMQVRHQRLSFFDT